MNYLQTSSLPPVILLPAYGLGNAVHGLADERGDVFRMAFELIGPGRYQQQTAGGAVVHALGRRVVDVRKAIVLNPNDREPQRACGIHDVLLALRSAGRDQHCARGCLRQASGFLLFKQGGILAVADDGE